MEIDSFDIRKPFRMMKRAVLRHKWIALATWAVTMGLMIAFIVYFPPVYEASVKVLARTAKDDARDYFYGEWNVFRKGEDPRTEGELVRTGPVITEVIDTLGLKYDDVYHPLMQTVYDLWGACWVGKQYKKIKRYIFPPKLTPWTLTPEEVERARTIHDFGEGIRVKSVSNTDVARITVLGPSARVAEMANLLMSVYMKHRSKRNEGEAMAAYNALTEQVERARAKLAALEQEFEVCLRDTEVKFDFSKERADIQAWAEQESSLLDIRASIRQVESRLAEVNRQMPSEPETEVASRTMTLDERKANIRNALTGHELKMVEMRHLYNEGSREVVELQSSIDQLKKMLADLEDMRLSGTVEQANPIHAILRQEQSNLQLQLAGLRAQEAAKQQVVEQYRARLEDLPAKQREHMELSRRLRLADSEYQILVTKQLQAYVSGLTESKSAPSLTIVENATPPGKPIRPKTKWYLLGAAAVGVLLGIGTAYLKNVFDSKIRAREDVEQVVHDPVYAEIRLGGNGGGKSLLLGANRTVRRNRLTHRS